MSFTVLGLWLLVVQQRRREWVATTSRRWGAQLVAMHFALPGIMSLLNAASPDNSLLWRASFAIFAVAGGVGMLLLGLGGHDGSRTLPRLLHWSTAALYGAVAAVAVFADGVAAGLGVEPLQAVAVLLSLVFLLGVGLALSLVLEAPPEEPRHPGRA